MSGSTQPFKPSGTVTVTATVASVSAPLTSGDTVLVFNASAAVAYVAFGNGAATATTASFPVPAVASRLVNIGPVVNTAAVMLGTGAGNVYVSAGTGTAY